MTVLKVLPAGLKSNAYICTADGKRAVIIDPADEHALKECERRGLTPVAVLLTHGHFDHVGGCGELFARGVPIYCGENEKDFIFSRGNLSVFGGVRIPHFEIEKTLSDGEKITLGGMTFETIATPGHTVGSVCYRAEDTLFSGDTLFKGGVGRTDLYGGSLLSLESSLKKITALDGNLCVRCGHGDDTMLDFERVRNPYLT